MLSISRYRGWISQIEMTSFIHYHNLIIRSRVVFISPIYDPIKFMLVDIFSLLKDKSSMADTFIDNGSHR